jgi:hypothetical protein
MTPPDPRCCALCGLPPQPPAPMTPAEAADAQRRYAVSRREHRSAYPLLSREQIDQPTTHSGRGA